MDMAISNINGIGSKVQDIPLPGSVSGNSTPQKESSAQVTEEFVKLDNETVKQLIEEIQSHLQSMNISLSFSAYGNESENVAVVVTDKETGKIIREIPSKELQNLYTKLEELVGIIFNHSV
jgi:flagellar protein FlaG